MRIGSRNVCCNCCTKESSYNTFLTRKIVPQSMLWLLHKRVITQNPPKRGTLSPKMSCDCCTKESSYKVLLTGSTGWCSTRHYYWQQSMPPKEQWLLSLCTIDVCLHRRTMISILVMSILKFSVCLRSRVWDYDSMFVSMKRTMFKCLTNVFVKTNAKLGRLNPRLIVK